MNTNKQIQLLEKLTDKKIVLKENEDFFKQHILSKEEKLERRLNSVKSILYKGGTYKGDLDLSNIEGLDSLYNLERVEGNLDLNNTPIESLGKLKHVEGWLDLDNTQIKDLGNLKYVGGYLFLENTQIKDLGNLEYVGSIVYINENTPLFHNKELIEEYKRKGFSFYVSSF